MIFYNHKLTEEEICERLHRWRWKFAFFPKRVGHEMVVWLGWYQVRYMSTPYEMMTYTYWYERRLNPEQKFSFETDHRTVCNY